MKQRLAEYLLLNRRKVCEVINQMVDTGKPGRISFADDGNIEFILYLNHKFDNGKAWLQMYVTDANDNLIYKKVSESEESTVDDLKEDLESMYPILMYKILDNID